MCMYNNIKLSGEIIKELYDNAYDYEGKSFNGIDLDYITDILVKKELETLN